MSINAKFLCATFIEKLYQKDIEAEKRHRYTHIFSKTVLQDPYQSEIKYSYILQM